MELLMILALPLMMLGGFALDGASRDDEAADRADEDEVAADREPIV